MARPRIERRSRRTFTPMGLHREAGTEPHRLSMILARMAPQPTIPAQIAVIVLES